ncbi:MAG: hypothetical protein GY953_45405 [bacterium]|nr:hypothetical protein [bacterium]
MANLYLPLGIFGLALQLVVVYALTRGPYRQFPGVTAYLLVLFLTGVADLAVFFNVGSWPDWYREYYYLNNTLRHFAGFAALVSLIYMATAHAPNRVIHRLKVCLGTLGVVGGCFLLSSGTWPDAYMNEVSRNLSFSTVVLNLILWFSLIKYCNRDTRLFLVSGGLGLNMTGEAIGQSLVPVSKLAWHAGNLIAIASHLLCLYIWWVAFRRSQEPAQIPDGLPSPR